MIRDACMGRYNPRLSSALAPIYHGDISGKQTGRKYKITTFGVSGDVRTPRVTPTR
jgi:hypothetical protein